MSMNRGQQGAVAALAIGAVVALWGVAVGRFGLYGLLVGLGIVYAAMWYVTGHMKAARQRHRDALRADIAALRERLNDDPTSDSSN